MHPVKESLELVFKHAVERLVGDRIWIEPSSDASAVAELLQAVRPRATATPLIRIGVAGDGGYLVPDDLDGLQVCISPGVSNNVIFDEVMANRGLNVFMADASVAGPPVENEQFHFVKKFLDVFDDDKHMRLETLCKSIPADSDGDRILQMDIEGAEYRVLLDASDETLQSFRIMVIEFHHLTRMFGRFSFRLIQATFAKLLRFHHVVHIHPNNVSAPTIRGNISIPPVMEFTFYRKDRAVLDERTRLAFPHPLDSDNRPDRATVPLPACWR